MKITNTIAAALIALGTIMPTIAAPNESLRSFKPSKHARKTKPNTKLANRLKGSYGVVSYGRQVTLNILEASCAGPICLYEYALAGTHSIGFSVGTRLFFTEWFVDGHALYFAKLPKSNKSAAILYVGFLDGDCYMYDATVSVCDHSVYEFLIDEGQIHNRG